LCKPGGRTPFVIFRHGNNTVHCWVMMHVLQPRQIRSLKSDVTVPKLEPDLPPVRFVPAIKLPSGLAVKFAEELRSVAASAGDAAMKW